MYTRLPPYEQLVREVPKAHKTTEAIDSALDSLPQLDGKSLLLKTPFISSRYVAYWNASQIQTQNI